jgi:hypothetical protein
MKNLKSSISTSLTILSDENKVQVKGGLLLYCEEKRIKLLNGSSFVVQNWKMKNDGQIALTVKM